MLPVQKNILTYWVWKIVSFADLWSDMCVFQRKKLMLSYFRTLHERKPNRIVQVKPKTAFEINIELKIHNKNINRGLEISKGSSVKENAIVWFEANSLYLVGYFLTVSYYSVEIFCYCIGFIANKIRAAIEIVTHQVHQCLTRLYL